MLRASVYAVPLVTLKHGGQLQGRSVTYDGKSVDIFLGKSVYKNHKEDKTVGKAICLFVMLCIV